MKFACLFSAAFTLIAMPAIAQGSASQDAAALIEQADANGDGNISKAEFLARRSEAFKDLDADTSGALTEAEFELAVAQRMKRFTGRAFAKADKDGNGVISQAEWDENPPRAFDRLDKNSDGILTPSERQRIK
jgi:Ca2+-binding EF-hand superfamily protein